uniref:Uncharacterized protein n=1 Tax=viral metagenome TaxID=1070528 RepID=A0A6M3JBH8_9ZZZZ
MIIEGGSTQGYRMDVGKDGRAFTDSVSKSRLSQVSKDSGKSFSWTYARSTMNASKTVLLIQNDSTSEDLCIDKVRVSADMITEVAICSPVHATFAGDSISAVNLNRASNVSADATAYANETANTQANNILKEFLQAGIASEFNLDGAARLDYHHTIAIIFAEDVGKCSVTIFAHFE